MQKPSQKAPLYPQVIESNPDSHSPFRSNPNPSSSSLYPSVGSSMEAAPKASAPMYPPVDVNDLVENLFPDIHKDDEEEAVPSRNAPAAIVEEALVKIPGAIVHLIDRQDSVELASGDLTVVRLRQGNDAVAILVRVDGKGGDGLQWPLATDEAVVKLDEAHYFFTLRVPDGKAEVDSDSILNYGLTFSASKGRDGLLRELDGVLENYSAFSVQKVSKKVEEIGKAGRAVEEEKAAGAYWTTLAPNVEDYSGSVARVIAAGSGQLIKGIFWCGDVTVDRIKWGNEFMKKRMDPNSKPAEISPEALRRIKRVKKVSKMSDKVVSGILSGVVKVSGFFTSSVVNSKAGKKFFGLLPGEIVLASLDGFGKVCDAVEHVGKNVLSTSSVVTTGLVSHRYGDQAAEITQEGLGAAGHALGTAWAVFKIRKALNPKSAIKPTTLVKTAAKTASVELKGKKSK
ncbi:hypothetical protein QJS04_geneDACA001195 [Acorus gramineus]|uniref:Senescence domain-containing protein n=1 Tax=Acorus gramineus TaxID=55184 RepID=A0AAV9AD59_ACOGR|nr:hypothetical protein QJS04_geneDACA001195 [Acorus gramineus]